MLLYGRRSLPLRFLSRARISPCLTRASFRVSLAISFGIILLKTISSFNSFLTLYKLWERIPRRSVVVNDENAQVWK